MFEIYYKKNDNSALFKEFDLNKIKHIQNYIPLYGRFFNLQETNYQNINLNQPYHITNLEKTDQKNTYNCQVKSDNNEESAKAFFKFSPLIDPIKFMVGKYGDLTEDIKKSLPKLSENKCHPKVLDSNNSAYVDGFFTYLTSNVLHHHKFVHGLDFFGSFLGIQEKFNMNIFDDLEYLNDSKYFHEQKGKLFDIEAIDEEMFFDADTRNYKKKLQIDRNISNKSVYSLNGENFDDLFITTSTVNNEPVKLTEALVFEFNLKNKNAQNNSSRKSDSTCSSRSSHTSDGSNKEEESSSDEEEEEASMSSFSSMDSDIICNAIIKDFPVQIICLEKMEATLDSLLGEELSDHEWRSCLFQIIMTLIAYQKMFNFTHNDLHTNNIMFNKTDKQFLYYRYNKVYYKVPTYGRLFKVIDFGRSIYSFKGKFICSDSYHPKGDAATQYNCQPYMNDKKPRLDPNPSFDLCRLGCALYDFFMDDIDDIKTCGDPIAALISEWCCDDKGRNILYKKCGEERYPDFKLYKMIARSVHNHTPQKQVSKPVFSSFVSNRKKCGKKKFIDIDALPIYA
jgi:hypothetical protein